MTSLSGQTRSRTAWLLTIVCGLIVVATLAIPMYVIRPFRPQDPQAFALALTVRGAAPWVSAFCALITAGAIVWGWKAMRFASKIFLSLIFVVTAAGAYLTHINIFEVMFKPYPSPAFEPSSEAKVDADDKVLAVTINGESHAFPIRTMGYHHIVNDVIAGEPIAATYCTLCHTGLVWSRKLMIPIPLGTDCDCTLTFRLAGINNGNAVLRDEQTNSIWQQSTGEAIFGRLKGRHLSLVHSDELTFALWRSEQPNGVVLKPEAQYEPEYDPKDWESHVERTHAVVDTSKSGIEPHELMLGITLDSRSKAYPMKSILNSGLIEDRIGANPVLIVVGSDHASIRSFRANLPEGSAATFVRAGPAQTDALFTDTESGSEWNFHGCAISGKYSGRCLEAVDAHKDFWFDWMNHNPSTSVFQN